MGCFWPKYMFELKKYKGVMFDDTKYWCKVWRKTDLQKWHEKYSKFSPKRVRKSKNWDFDGILLSKVENVWTWNLQVSYVPWQWRMKQNWLVSSKLIWGILGILTRALKNLKNLHFIGLLLTKAYNVWDKKVQMSYIWWHFRLMQNLKENWPVLSKMKWRIIILHRLKK